jgi:hypothetical protein
MQAFSKLLNQFFLKIQTEKKKALNIWALILTFLFPFFGFITYLIFRKSNNRTANLSLVVSLVSLIIIFLIRNLV